MRLLAVVGDRARRTALAPADRPKTVGDASVLVGVDAAPVIVGNTLKRRGAVANAGHGETARLGELLAGVAPVSVVGSSARAANAGKRAAVGDKLKRPRAENKPQQTLSRIRLFKRLKNCLKVSAHAAELGGGRELRLVKRVKTLFNGLPVGAFKLHADALEAADFAQFRSGEFGFGGPASAEHGDFLHGLRAELPSRLLSEVGAVEVAVV